jgi:hypothetical protein
MNYINSFIKPRKTGKTEISIDGEVGLPIIPEGLPGSSSKGEVMVKRNHRQDYAEYLEGDSWRCSKSPSKAHYWVVGSQTICKYCHTAKHPEIGRLAGDFTAFTITK